jgi:putative transposase
MVTIPKALRYRIIYNLSNTLDVKILCKIAKVSISWYYKHRKLILTKTTKEERDKKDTILIQEISVQSKQKYGYRTITMKLRQRWIYMNHKKVLRIMKISNLLAKVRRRNPYKQIMKKTQEHRVVENKLNREFTWITPLTKIWTDISYMRFKWRWIYFSLVKDMVTAEVLWANISDNLWLWIVHKTLDILKKKYRDGELNGALFHSDQWFHYTHPSFWKYLNELWCIQSMSRKWNCIDNAPTESFFWHMKDEIDLTRCDTFEELEKYIDAYIFEYNNNRPQWSRKKMTPVQYRNHLLTL